MAMQGEVESIAADAPARRRTKTLFYVFAVLAIVAIAAVVWLVMRGLLVEAAIATFALLMAVIVVLRSRRAVEPTSEPGEAVFVHSVTTTLNGAEPPVEKSVEPPVILQSIETGRDDLIVEELPQMLKLADAATLLEDIGAKKVLFVSPEGDAAAAASIRYAREKADKGGRVVLVDMTASSAIARPMLEGGMKSGITDLLAGSARYADAIHADLYSDAHVVPLGRVDPQKAMSDAERLPIILNALAVAYDVVVIECGASSAEGLHRLAGEESAICISIVQDRRRATELKQSMIRLGYPKPLLVWAEA